MCQLRGQSLRGALQVKAGVLRTHRREPDTVSAPDPASARSAPQRSTFERGMERFVVLVGHAAMAMMMAGMGWVFLASFAGLTSPGFWLWEWAHPQRSPMGPWGAVIIVWPAVGLAGLLVQGLAEGAFQLVGQGLKRASKWVRPSTR